MICRRSKCYKPVSVLQSDGEGLCEYHWEKYCEQQDKESEKKWLDPIEKHIRQAKRNSV